MISRVDARALVVFERMAITGELTFVQVLRDGVDGVQGLERPFSVTVSPDGKNVYVADSAGDSVAMFARPATSTGALSGSGE